MRSCVLLATLSALLGCSGTATGDDSGVADTDTDTDADTDTDTDTDTDMPEIGDPKFALTFAEAGPYEAGDGNWWGPNISAEVRLGGDHDSDKVIIELKKSIDGRGTYDITQIRYTGLSNGPARFIYAATSGTIRVEAHDSDWLFARIDEPILLHGQAPTPTEEVRTITSMTIDSWPHF